jgi:hypothetical protein
MTENYDAQSAFKRKQNTEQQPPPEREMGTGLPSGRHPKQQESRRKTHDHRDADRRYSGHRWPGAIAAVDAEQR